MSTYIRGFTEAKIDGKWHCIDFFQEKSDGSMRLINCISGYGMVKHIKDSRSRTTVRNELVRK